MRLARRSTSRLAAVAAGFFRVAAIVPILLAAAGGAEGNSDPPPDPEWAAVLAEEDAAIRVFRLRELGRDRDAACAALARFAADPDDGRRENAVRGLDELGCARLADYAPYQHDRSPWVAVALARAVERRRIAGMVPFLIDHLEDPRRVVDGGEPRTIGAIARRALRVVSARSLAYDPAAPAPDRAAAVQRWRRWYADHRDEPRAVWLEAGIAEARAGLTAASPAVRFEALRQLALIGPPAAAALREVLRRGPADLTVGVLCGSDEPPRVTDTLECRLLVQNAADRRLPIAPASEARVVVEPVGTTPPPAPAAPPRRGAPARPPRPAPTPSPADVAAGPAGDPDAAYLDLAESIVDLAPGEILERGFRVGPVPGSGRYTVRAVIPDRASVVLDGPGIEATTVVRFEQ